MLVVLSGRSEDIDIFKGGGAEDPSPPNILILLDNTANSSAQNQAWNKNDVLATCGSDATCTGYVNQVFGNNSSLDQGQVELAALKLVLNELVCAAPSPMKVNLGIMMLKPSKGSYANDAGTSIDASGLSGFIRRAVLPLDTHRCATLIADLDYLFDQVTNAEWKAPVNANYGGALFDAFKYFGGHTNPAGAGLGRAGSPVGHISFGPKRFATAEGLEEASAFSDDPPLTYLSPITAPSASTCGGKNQILLIGNGYPDTDDAGLLTGLGYSWDNAQFARAASGRFGDVWARFLATTDVSPVAGQQTLVTSALNVFSASEDANQTALLKSMARNGNGSYYEVGGSLGALIASLQNYFIAINSANQSFAPPALPAAIGSGGLKLNQVYLGLFRPEKRPRWFGNLKLYRYYQDPTKPTNPDGTPRVLLEDGQATPVAVQSGAAPVADNAISYWTSPSIFWNFRCGPSGSLGDPLLCGNPISPSDSPDGAVPEKGGAAQKLRAAYPAPATANLATRKVYTDNGTARIDFNSANVTIQLDPPGTTLTADERAAIVNWVRGLDNIGENTEVANGPRPSIIGDILHSEPLALNYGTSAGGCSTPETGEVVTFYAGNDGMLHAVRGGVTEGDELWSFIPSIFLDKLKRLRDNAPGVTFPAPVPATEFNKPYLIDGSLSLYAPDDDFNCKPDKVWLFLTMRRGGPYLYALNVTDRNNPTLMWKKSASDTGYGQLGQSWSKLKVALLPDALAPNRKPYLVFGAGYDPGAEDRPFNTTTGLYGDPVTRARGSGTGVFVVDAETGTVKKFLAAGDFSIPSDLAVIPNINTGLAERAYVGDTGGDIWKIGFPQSAAAMNGDGNWVIQKFASLGDPADLGKSGANARGFLYPPSVARCGGNDMVLIGSGDREKPFDPVVQNRFYGLQDAGSGYPITTSDLTDVTTLGVAVGASAKGWYFNLATGEKTVTSALTQAGTTTFATHEAGSNSGGQCSAALGQARRYRIKCATGWSEGYQAGGNVVPRALVVPGGGFLPSPSFAKVKVDGTGNTFGIIATGGRTDATPTPVGTRRFTYWYREGLD